MSFHQFNVFTGRLKQSTQLEALFPLSPQPLQKVDPPKMMFDSIKTQIARVNAKTQKGYSTLNPKIAETMKKYQADPTVPTYLLRGKPDRFLFRLSVSLVIVGFIGNMILLRELRKKF